MSTANNTLRVSDLDFFSIKNNLKDFLRSQSTFSDYDFDGSGLSVLLDILAYNTYYNSFYLNMMASESYLDTAQIRQNILSLAKAINYVPASPQGAIAKINLVVTPAPSEDTSTNILTLEKYTKFLGKDIDGVNYQFVTLNSNTSSKVGGSFYFSNVMIKQAEVMTHEYLVSANTNRYIIPSPSVDTTTIFVQVQQSVTNTSTTLYTLANDLTEIKGDSTVYFLEEDENLQYSIYFGDNVIGKRPANGSIVIITHFDTIGSAANNISRFYPSQAIGGKFRNNVNIQVVSASHSGTDKEDIDKIRFRAPYFYTTQNRAVTVNDYETLITKDYNNIDAVSVWGGEDNDPIIYGKVFMSLKTKGYYTLTNLEKEEIKNTLITNRNVLTIIPEIVDPDYVFMQIRGKVYYNPSLTAKNAADILQGVKTAIQDYSVDELDTFKSTFKKSKLQYYIENSDPSITASDIHVYMQKRIPITVNTVKNYTIKFNAPLRKGDYIEKLYTYPQLTVADKNSILRNIFFEEVPDSFTGIDSIKVTNPGVNFESTPEVVISGDGIGATARATVVRGKINNITVTNKGSGYSAASISIVGDGSEATAEAILEARNGTLRTFYYKSTGEKIVVSENAGTINYDTGEIVLSSLAALDVIDNDLYESNILTVNVVPENEVILPLRNRITSIDFDNIQSIQIETIAEA